MNEEALKYDIVYRANGIETATTWNEQRKKFYTFAFIPQDIEPIIMATPNLRGIYETISYYYNRYAEQEGDKLPPVETL